jgi:hypothetical protein
VLTKTNFEFNGEDYLQIGGTSMGTNVAPSYAILFMDKLECRALNEVPLKPLFYGRYIDDIFMIWQHGVENLSHFIQHMNNIHHNIKFTMEYSPDQVNFLDTTVVIDKIHNQCYTKLYTKPTDTHSYLFWTSAHNKPCKSKGPFGQFLRVRRICTKHEDFQRESTMLIQYYQNRGYPLDTLIAHYNRANLYSQRDALSEKITTTQTRPVLVTTFNPGNPDIKNILNRHWNIIQYSSDCANNFDASPITGFKRCPNLKDQLVRSKVRYPPDPKRRLKWHEIRPPICTRLGRCTYCPNIAKTNSITSSVTHKTFPIRNITNHKYISCEINNIIYIITCKKCSIQYVGETGRRARDRLYEHLYSIKNANKIVTPVSDHFSRNGHNYKDISFQVIERCHNLNNASDTSQSRKRREMYWMWLLKTVTPLGLNHMV